MTETTPANRWRLPNGLLGDRDDRSVNLRFALTCLLLLPLVTGLSLSLTGTTRGAASGTAVYVVLAAMTGLAFRHYPHDRLGWANIITMSRMAIIAALFAPISQPGMLSGNSSLAWAVLGIALVSLCLDGVDGFFARRQGLVSAFGARFDMEIDSVFALLLSLLALLEGKAGPWILLLGGMRYLFLAASLPLPWLDAPLPERFSRKVICVIQIAALITLLAPIISGPASWLLAAGATLLLTFSFGRDVVWLARNRS